MILRCAFLLALLSMWSVLPATAAATGSDPILRIEAGGHTLPIMGIQLDRQHQRLITISEDKTIRLWQLPQLRLLRILRVPIDSGNEGLLFAQSLSPDGQTLAVGGWTGWQDEQRARVYFFDLHSGRIIRRLDGLPGLVSALKYSPDGRQLMVGMLGHQGLRVYDTANGREIFRDPLAGEGIRDISAAPDGSSWLALSRDGQVNLYDGTFALLQRQDLGRERRPALSAIAPDGHSVLLGFADRPMAAVLSLPGLEVQTLVSLPAESGQRSLCCVEWLDGGKEFLATGEHEQNRARLFRWRRDGTPSAVTDLGRSRPGPKIVLDNGQIVIATDEPRLLLLDANGKTLSEQGTPARDLAGLAKSLQLSADGQAIGWQEDDGAWRIDIDRQRLERADHRHRQTLLAIPEASRQRHRVECTPGSLPLLDDRPIALDPYERCHSWAPSHAGTALYIGGDWSIRRLDEAGRPAWRIDTPGAVVGLLPSADGRTLVAALADGTLRWYRQDNGHEHLGLFLHANRQDWVMWRPDGYYVSSPNGDALVGWHINRGRGEAADFYSARQFERIFYRPDLIRRQLAADVPAETVAYSIRQLQDIVPARISLNESPASAREGQIALDIDITSEHPVLDYAIFQNGLPILRPVERQLTADERLHVRRTVLLTPSPEGDDIRVEAFNGRSMGLAETFLQGREGAAPASPKARHLYVLAIGINRFPGLANAARGTPATLRYAARDARAFARHMERHARHAGYAGSTIRIVGDGTGQPGDRARIEAALKLFARAGKDDTVVLFVASHGLSDRAGNFYILPRNARQADLDTLSETPSAAQAPPPSLLAGQTLIDALRGAAGRRLLVIDACQSAAIASPFDAYSLKKRSSAAHFAVMTASDSSESSQEYRPARHGLFTHALLEALAGHGDADRNGRLTLSEAHAYVADTVARLHDPLGGSQTPQLLAPAALRDLAVPSRPHAEKGHR